MFRKALLLNLWLCGLGLALGVPAQTSQVPGMPADPAMVEPPPPRVESKPSPTQPLPPPGSSAADSDADADGVPRPPVLPEPVESGEVLEPDITILHKDGAKIEEYRIKGRLYMVKITPSAGKPYYLVDRNGDGLLETRTSGLETPGVPQWVIFSW